MIVGKSYRAMEFVPRWAIVPRASPQSLTSHSFYTTLYVSHLCRLFKIVPGHTRDALEYALRHDALEIWTSDIPGPAKRDLIPTEGLVAYHEDFARMMGDEYAEAMVDQMAHGHAGVRIPISLLVKVADVLDQIFYLYGELLMGNTMIERIYRRAVGRLSRKLADVRGVATNDEQGEFLMRTTDLLDRTVMSELKKMAAEGAWLPVEGEDKADGV